MLLRGAVQWHGIMYCGFLSAQQDIWSSQISLGPQWDGEMNSCINNLQLARKDAARSTEGESKVIVNGK